MGRRNGSGTSHQCNGLLLSQCKAHTAWYHKMNPTCSSIFHWCVLYFLKPKDAFIKNLIIDEYIGNGANRVKNRDGFSEVTADIIFNIPVIKTANAHRGNFYRLMHIYLETIISYLPLLLSVTLVCLILEAGAPVYLYEYQHSLKMVQKRRPSFVGSDHTDEIFTVMGFCFTTTHIKLPREWNLKSLIWAWDIWFVSFWGFLGLECRIFYKIITLDPCFVEEEQLSRTMMSYWGNFARTG